MPTPNELVESVRAVAAYDGYPLAQVTLIQRDGIQFTPLLAHLERAQRIETAARKVREIAKAIPAASQAASIENERMRHLPAGEGSTAKQGEYWQIVADYNSSRAALDAALKEHDNG